MIRTNEDISYRTYVGDGCRQCLEACLVLFAQASWTRTRTPLAIETMLKHTDVCVVATGHVSQLQSEVGGHPVIVGFVRAVTDFAYRAWVEDLIVLEQWRSHGVGRILMEELQRTLASLGVPSVEGRFEIKVDSAVS